MMPALNLSADRRPHVRLRVSYCDCGSCDDCAVHRHRARINGETPDDVHARDAGIGTPTGRMKALDEVEA